MASFTFWNDPGHGWVQVSALDIVRAGLTPSAFSGYSYRQGRGTDATYYLEEDCDAPKFINAWTARFGKPELVDEYRANIFIRRLHRLCEG